MMQKTFANSKETTKKTKAITTRTACSHGFYRQNNINAV